jgi:hypothetical protein
MSTDSFVVQPLFFPGGSIGELAVNGTVNDLAVSGAEPKYLSASFILEEGFPLAQLAAIVDAMAAAAAPRACRSSPATPRSSSAATATAATSTRPASACCAGHSSRSASRAARRRDLVSGTIGDHGMAIMSVREGLEFESQIRSIARAQRHDRRGARCRGRGSPRHARPHARRPGLHAERDCAGLRRRHRHRRERACRCGPRCSRPASCSASIRSTWPTRARRCSSSRPKPPIKCWLRAARPSAGPRRRAHRPRDRRAQTHAGGAHRHGRQPRHPHQIGEQLPRICCWMRISRR